ncbi:MAG: hypothetical protein A4E44_01274 [Methanosaeta sp. PtaB.Bin018]|jgi:hypothetical protein|nr:MAG: hypothetical protein A4E44_01274 [Methanosaeta sp. PtaB.Bin018]OPY46812.1 MAG: hypothetical protein A4E46_00781 [Methanosaeta sp. PtaU1.Bin016]HOV51657.1 hypothetical protein [Methanothrix sp.]
MVLGGIKIKAIKLILLVTLLGMLMAVGSAIDRPGDRDHDFGGDHHHDHYDWLSPGGVSTTYYSWSYPVYYDYYWYPTYRYTYYPTYYYTTPVYTTYYYDPVVYDPWWAVNVYGVGGTTYYYSSGWSWATYHGSLFF